MNPNKLILAALLVSSFSFGQTLKDAIQKTDNERYSEATKDFKNLISAEPANGCYYFYYGENLYNQGEIDSAVMMWKKAPEVDPAQALSFVALGKAQWIKKDQAGARSNFTKALTMTKNKNAEVMRGIAEVYITSENKSLDEAITLLESAIKLDPKNEDGHLLMGDALYEKTPGNATNAMKSYNKVLEINPKSARGIVRAGKIYQRAQNYELANEKYKEAQKVDPTYAPAYRENAELNLMFKKTTAAAENWRKYLELNNSQEARYRFATAMFVGKEYCQVIPEIEALQAGNYNNFYMERMLAYSYAECTTDTDAFTKGIAASDRFFKITPAENVIFMDYKYRGMLYANAGKDSLAIIEYEKASGLDAEAKKELAGSLGKMYMKAKNYDKVISTYEGKLAMSTLTATENFELGRAYFFGPKNYVLADSAFARVVVASPSYVPGYFWRGRANFQIDPKNEKWMARPYYEKVVELIKPEERTQGNNKSMVIESSKYLGDYYVNSAEKDITKARVYWTIVKELDPTDAQAKAFFAKYK